MKTYAQKLLVAPPERLALFRFLVGIFSLIYLVARAPGFYQTAHSGASWRPVGICELLPILREAALDPLLASSLYGATILGVSNNSVNGIALPNILLTRQGHGHARSNEQSKQKQT